MAGAAIGVVAYSIVEDDISWADTAHTRADKPNLEDYNL
jgi:hypothetical protein